MTLLFTMNLGFAWGVKVHVEETGWVLKGRSRTWEPFIESRDFNPKATTNRTWNV